METPSGRDGHRKGPRRWVCALNYVLFRAIRAILVRLPHGGVRALADTLALIGWIFDPRHRKVTLENMALALPELSAKQRKATAYACFQSLAFSIFDVLASSDMSREEIGARLIPEGWHHLEDAEADGKGVILLTAHLGNWETAGQLFAIEGRPLSFMARPIDDARIERELTWLRERFGHEGVPKRGGIRRLLSVLRRQGHIYMMLDQRVHPNEGKAYRFFGRPAYTSPLVASLSIRTGAPVVPFYGIPTQDGRKLRVVIHAPIRPSDPPRPGAEQLDAVDRLTLRYVEELEAVIRERPELWFWMHRRWRKNPTLSKAGQASSRTSDANGDVCVERARHA